MKAFAIGVKNSEVDTRRRFNIEQDPLVIPGIWIKFAYRSEAGVIIFGERLIRMEKRWMP